MDFPSIFEKKNELLWHGRAEEWIWQTNPAVDLAYSTVRRWCIFVWCTSNTTEMYERFFGPGERCSHGAWSDVSCYDALLFISFFMFLSVKTLVQKKNTFYQFCDHSSTKSSWLILEILLGWRSKQICSEVCKHCWPLTNHRSSTFENSVTILNFSHASCCLTDFDHPINGSRSVHFWSLIRVFLYKQSIKYHTSLMPFTTGRDNC